jgi:LysR family glycine cleavage system transcriptional activator
MKHHLPPLDSLKVFEAAARQLSFSQAAQELCITKGAVSYRIRRLEEELDCALFRRTVRQVYLTNAGQQLLQTTQQLFVQLTSTLQKIRPGDSAHDVLVGATTYVALRWLSPRISGFSESNPEISILLQHSVNADGFSIQEVDFAIRWCRMEGLVDRNRVLELPMPLFPVCSPGLLERYQQQATGPELEVGDLNRAPLNSIPLLCEDRSFDLWQTWYGRQQPALQNPRRIIADANVRTQAAVDGQGWTMADALMQRELEAGDLVAPFSPRLEGYGYAIQTSPGRFTSQNALELRQWLVDNA